MKNIRNLVAASVLLMGAVQASETQQSISEQIFVTIGKNRYYNSEIGYMTPCVYDETLKKFVEYPACKLLTYETCKRTPAKDTLDGIPFKPKEFWEKPIDEQLVYLKDAILECSLPEIADVYHDNLAVTTRQDYYAKVPSYPYSGELEDKFEDAVWKILSKDYKIPLSEFKISLRSIISPGNKIYSAPLIVHFTNKLAPRYELHYTDKSFPTKVVKLPSEFELLIGKPDKGEVVYDFEKDEELNKKFSKKNNDN